MNKYIKVEYLCTHIENIFGVPIRLYKGNELCFYDSLVKLPKDPFLLYQKEVFAIESHVGYFITPHDNYFGVVNFKGNRIIIGPTWQIPLSEQELHKIAFELGVSSAQVEAFIAGMKSITPIPLHSVLQILCVINHLLNDGETLSLSDVTIVNLEQKRLIEKLQTEDAERTLLNADGLGEQFYPHNTMDIETYMLDLVRKGDVMGIKTLFDTMPAIRSGIIAQNDLRQAKNLLIVTTTLISRAAIYGGMDAQEALSLSDGYIQKAELMNTLDGITNLSYRLVLDYAERMNQLLFGSNSSKLVVKINNYIRQHLSDVITVEDLAKYLCCGRSRLSTNFKKETGENLSEFILKQKIEEGKKLLLYSDKTSVDISLYLGFSSQSHFSRTFKKYVGLAPNEFRITQKRQ